MNWLTFSANKLFSCEGLLAQAENYRHLGRNFQPGARSISLTEAGVAAALIIGVPLLLMLLGRFQRTRQEWLRNSPEALFGELCRAHGLAWGSRRLLRRCAKELRLDPPALLFLDPYQLDPEQLGAEGSARRDELSALRDRLLTSSGGVR